MDIVNGIIEFFNKAGFNALDNVSSLISIVLSVLVFFKIQKIESNYNARIRLPILVEKINEHASNLMARMPNYNTVINEVKLELAWTQADLESIYWKVDKSLRREVKNVIRKINEYNESKNKVESLSRTKRFFYSLGLYKVGYADNTELAGEKKQDEVYNIYNDVQTLLARIDNMQQDRMLE